ncbi:hypothetical protein IKQ19_06180 [Candidatus Saccharibacteria bacterium]|nr:hypothetical protein [Candidatus Saccharibacteria bacterium]
MNDTLDFTVQNDSVADVDLLKDGTHQKIADRLFDLITKSETKGLTIGLEGSWGSGKSTVVNLLRKKLEKTNETFVFYIDSWVHEGDYLRRAFLESFAEQLQEKGVEKKKIEKIKNEITNKVVVKHNDTSPKTKPLGTILALMTIFLLPIGFSFIDNGCGKLFPNGNFSPNKLFIIGLILVLIPILVALIAWCLNKKKGLTSVFWTTETTETTTTETTEEPEKTSIEFENFFKRLLKITNEKKWKNIVCVIDNLDRINPDDALKIWSTLQVFVQSKNPNGRRDDSSSVWVIVPYDESGLRMLWDKKEKFLNENDENNSQKNEKNKDNHCSKSFFDKNFQLRIDVPKMLFEGWEDYATKMIDKSLIGFDDSQRKTVLEMLKRGRLSIDDAPSPREIKTYVNQVGFLYDLHRKNNISLDTLCFYVDLKYLQSFSADRIRKGLLEGKILPQNRVLGLFKDNGEIKKEMSAILFNVEKEKGLELLLENPVVDALENRDIEKLMHLKENHEHAILTLVESFLAENKFDCKKYIHTLKCVFEHKIDDALLYYFRKNIKFICDKIGDIKLDDIKCIFGIISQKDGGPILQQLSKAFIENQYSLLKATDPRTANLDQLASTLETKGSQIAIANAIKSITAVYDIVNDPNLIYLDYSQLRMIGFYRIAETIDVREMPKIGKLVRKIELLDEDVAKLIQHPSPTTEPPIKVIHLGCFANCSQWVATLSIIHTLIINQPNQHISIFMQCLNMISVMQNFILSKETDNSIKNILEKPIFWNYITAIKTIDEKKIAAYLLAKYFNDLQVGTSLNGLNDTRALFKDENKDIIAYFCNNINATKKSSFIWHLSRNVNYKLIGGIIEKQLKEGQHWFFMTDNPLECFANAISYFNDENTRIQILNEFISQSDLIHYIQSSSNVNLTNRLQACKMLLESEYSTEVVEVVKKELAVKKKDVWLTALEQGALLLDVVRKCHEITNHSLDELTNDYADGFVEYVKSKWNDEKLSRERISSLSSLYDCMNESFKTYVSDKIATEILDKEFVFSSNLKDFIVEKINFKSLTNKNSSVAEKIKNLVDEKKWNALENALLIIKKCEALKPPQHYTDVMRQPLKDLDAEATFEQKQIVDGLCEFFNIDPNSIRSTETPEENSES